MDSGRDSRGKESNSSTAGQLQNASTGRSADLGTAQPSHLVSPPTIALPKGGGAIRGIGEKFAANPVTGTGSMTVPIATSPGRSGFGPQLSLSYDSGSGNGTFGFGWSLSLPAITRKTDKGLPQFRDADESDEFILSGAEDLVPVLNEDGSRFEDSSSVAGYRIHRYRPRIEGLFARIERWTNNEDHTDVHWRSISKDNVLTLYGKDADSRICDPVDQGRTFTWLICETRDDKGNAIVYGYKREDSTGVDLIKPNERNRGDLDDPRREVNRYIDSIRYGNRRPLLNDAGRRPRFLHSDDLDGASWMFEVVFDYHEPRAGEPELELDQIGEWTFRKDPFSSYRAGFEVRTTRLCQRVLMFHRIPDLATGEKGYDGLVRSTDFTYSHEQDPDNARNPVYTFLRAATQTGYKRREGGYVTRSLPPLEFEYTQPIVQDKVQEVDPESLENLPIGLDGASYQWTDLHGEGIPGILTEQAGAWFYKRNLSPLRGHQVEFAPMERVAVKPNLALAGGQAQFMDLAGDGQPDLAVLDGPMPGLYEHDGKEGWQPFRPFSARLNRDMRDPNLKLVDLTGDGHADVLITEDDAFVWHASLAEQGFGPARRALQALDEEKGPRLVFADGTQAIYLADLSGDGLTDLARVRNGEVCYWPNLGYGRFGAKITMDHVPLFDHPDQFDQKRIRLADIDGTGTTDIIYLHRDGARLYFNQSGNGWSAPQVLKVFPRVDELTTITPADLLGNGTACLVWSSPLPGDAQRQMRYVDLMGGQKPHLLVKTENNLGAETHVAYAPSTKFYLRDKAEGKPWITRLPFPVHVVERVETRDRISRNRFVTRYAYHHGYFDGEEREFRGFGMVEQWDTEELGSLESPATAEETTTGAPQSQEPQYDIGQVATCSIRGAWQFSFRPITAIRASIYPDGGWYYFFEGVKDGIREDDVLLIEEAGSQALGGVWDGTPGEEVVVRCATNIDEASYVPPVHTKTWLHTGLHIGRNHVSDFFAGLLDGNDIGEYYREPGLTDEEARRLLLKDTVPPDDLTIDEEREACRALKGSMLRQEVYALDGTKKANDPYTVTEQNFDIRLVQRRRNNRHAVFFAHPREAINYHYERDPADPRISHALTLEVDDFGNVLKEAAVGYGRRETIRIVVNVDEETGQIETDDILNPGLAALDELDPSYRKKQTQSLITYTENQVTNSIDLPVDGPEYDPDNYRASLPAETRTYELTGYSPQEGAWRFNRDDFVQSIDGGLGHIFDNETGYEEQATGGKQRRLIEQLRTLYRPDDLGAAEGNTRALLGLGQLQSRALPGESYKLALTSEFVEEIFRRPLDLTPSGVLPDEIVREDLLSTPADVLCTQGSDRGGYVDLDNDGRWWIPSGRIFFSTDSGDSPAQEQTYARENFFLPHRYHDPFDQTTTVFFDDHDLLIRETRDSLDNRVTVGERQADSTSTPTDIDARRPSNDYRVLQPELVMDPNRNRTQVAFDALGMVVGTAVMGKPPPQPAEGDSLEGFATDLAPSVIREHLNQPLVVDAHIILGNATTRLVYDLKAYLETKDQRDPQPTVVYTLVRETHAFDPELESNGEIGIQHSFSYSDGFGREIQKKVQAEPGPLPRRGEYGEIIVGPDGLPEMTDQGADSRWVGSGWTIFNNKGKPVHQYEPFFTDTHRFEFDVRIGVSPVLFYDPLGRAVATLHPNHTTEKVVFNPWLQATWDVNDMVARRDESGTEFDADPNDDEHVGDFFLRLPETDYLPTWYAQRIDGTLGTLEQEAASTAAVHAETPALSHFDVLGRAFLTVAHNRFFDRDGQRADDKYRTRLELDIEGNQREVIDAMDRVVMRYHYDMLGNRIHQASMEAGERWMLNDVRGNPIRAWDSRRHIFRTEYDPLRRPLNSFVTGADPADPSRELLVEHTIYGEARPIPEAKNLRGQVVQLFDQAGVVTSDDYDFKSNLLSSSRQLAANYKSPPNWNTDPALEEETFTSSTVYDALNRPIQLIAPHSDQSGTRFNVIQPGYNEANLLERVNVWLNQNTEPADLLAPATASLNAVTDIDYDAKGQRTSIDYGNGVRTTYEYDPLTFRLARLLTVRGNKDASECSPILNPRTCEDPPAICSRLSTNKCILQNLHYTYDPAGNITQIRDDAQQIIFFRNTRVTPHAEYTYDAIYRLIEATGREHLGQNGGGILPPTPTSDTDAPRVGLLHPGDGNAMGRYCETYVYDAVGNFLEMSHRRSCPETPSWMRTYAYDETSLIEDGADGTPHQFNNRLSTTTIGTTAEPYRYDGNAGLHGNITAMPHLPLMEWDFKDQLQAIARQVVNNGGTPEITYYVYDAAGQRVRKVTELEAHASETPRKKNERIYLGGFEIYRECNGAGDDPELERETLHVMDDQQRIALVETKTIEGGREVADSDEVIRFQLNNHLGSSSLELDESARVISYEEYYPYGSTSYQAQTSTVEVSAKRYRYTGMERDEETGLNYHTARYYASWLGRWTSCDPVGLTDGVNVYAYAGDNAVRHSDRFGRDRADEVVSLIEGRLAVAQQTLSEVGEIRADLTNAAEGYNRALRDLEELAQQDTADAVERRAAATEQLATHRTRLTDSGLAERANQLLEIVQQPASEGSLGREISALQEELRLITELGDSDIDPDRLRALGNYVEGLDQTVDTLESQLQSLERQLPEFLRSQAEIAGHARAFNSIPSNLLNDLPANLGATHLPRPDPPPRLDPPDVPRTGGRARRWFSRTMGNRWVRRGVAVIPIIGISAGAYSAYQSYRQGDYVGVGLDLVGFIPGLGDIVDAARLGFGEGQTVTVQEEHELERQWFERMHPRARQNFCEGNPGYSGCR